MARAEPPDSTAPWQLQPATVASGEQGKKKQWIVSMTWPGGLGVGQFGNKTFMILSIFGPFTNYATHLGTKQGQAGTR